MNKILIIEDEIVVAAGVKDILENNGLEVIGIATSYDDAKKIILTSKIDLILCDINLGEERTGIDLMKEVSEKVNIPFLYISAYCDSDILHEANQTNPINFITKPFNIKQLLVSIEIALESHTTDDSEIQPTPTELHLIKLLSKGLNSKEIAFLLSKSPFTIETHRRNMIKKFNVSNISELICLATTKKWITYSQENSAKPPCDQSEL